jgi:arylsulfatase A-like enzyme
VGLLGGAALAILETGVRYLPASAGTDLTAGADLPILAALAYAATAGLGGALHPLLAPAVLVGIGGAHPDPGLLGIVLAVAASALGGLGACRPRWAVAAGLLVLAGLLFLPRSDRPEAGTPSRPDIVLIVLDTVGARYTSLHGYPLDTSPVLERVAAEGAWFRRAVATAPWTVPSHATLFTGDQPRRVGCHHEHPALPEGVPTTAEQLANAGYRTGAFVANPWVGRFNGLLRGFQHRELVWEVVRLTRSFAATRWLHAIVDRNNNKGAPLLAKRTLDWLGRGGDTPSFAFVNLLEAHSPFHHVPDAGRYGVANAVAIGERTHQAQSYGPDLIDYPQSGEVEAAKRLYAAGIRYVDGQVGLLLDELAARGRLDRTVVLVTSDHGEAFGEHGFHGHMVGLYEETLHVPLVLRYPPVVRPGTVVDALVSLCSVHATLLEFATGAARAGSLLESLREDAETGPVVSEQRRPLQVLSDFRRGAERDLSAIDTRALRIRVEDWVLLRETPAETGEVRWSFYDLTVDPAEQHNLFPDPRAARLQKALEEYDSEPVAVSGEVSVPPSLREQLNALGYLGGR